MKIFGYVLLIAIGLVAGVGFFSTQEINSEIEIDASHTEVWDTVTDFGQYSKWNPFITQINGYALANSEIAVTIRAPIIKKMDFMLKVASVEPEDEMIWLGETIAPNVLDGRHYFRIEQISENRVKFSQGERFSGLLLYLSWPFISGSVEKNFTDMNQALKQHIERSGKQ